MAKFLNLILYGGLEKEEYQTLKEDIREQNRVNLGTYSMLGALLFLVLTVISLCVSGFVSNNTWVYAGTLAGMAALAFCAFRVLPSKPHLVHWLVLAFEFLCFLFSLILSLLHPQLPAVTGVAVMFISPLLFFDSPLNLAGVVTAVVVPFCLISGWVKPPEIAQIDQWNMVLFGLLAIGANTLIARTQTAALIREKRIAYLSQTDLLTGLRNRNCYEEDLARRVYPDSCRESLCCVYADVNGLHELNNSQGHQAGDRMLITVAEEMNKKLLGGRVYRTGGDEYVAFLPDVTEEAISERVSEIDSAIRDKGYDVAFGFAIAPREHLDVLALVREAEGKMYQEKEAYYSREENKAFRDRHILRNP